MEEVENLPSVLWADEVQLWALAELSSCTEGMVGTRMPVQGQLYSGKYKAYLIEHF